MPNPNRERLQQLLMRRVDHPSAGDATGQNKWCFLIPIRTCGSRTPLIAVQGGGAGVPGFRRLAEHLGDEQPVYFLQTGNLSAKPTYFESIETMAECQLEGLLDALPDGPYVLCGHSIGAFIAWEMAHRLALLGRTVKHLILLDQPGPGIQINWQTWLYWEWTSLRRLPRGQHLGYLWEKIRFRIRSSPWVPRVIKALLKEKKKRHRTQTARSAKPTELVRVQILESSLAALKRYKPPTLDLPTTLIRAESSAPRIHADPHGGWGAVTSGRIRVFDLPGHHLDQFTPERVGNLATLLRSLLASETAG